MIIGIVILTILITAGSIYLILRPRLKQTQQINEQIVSRNRELLQIANQLHEQIAIDSQQEQNYLEKINILKNNVQDLENQSKQAASIFYQKNMEIAQQNFDRDLKNKESSFNEAVQNFDNQLQNIMAEKIEQFQSDMTIKQNEINLLNNKLGDLQSKVNAAVLAAKRAEEMVEKNNFYRIQLASWEKEEINLIREVGSHLKNIEPLNKVIWKCYYEKPTTDLIGRVIGSGIHTGIYKITNIDNQKCYVGQAVNIGR